MTIVQDIFDTYLNNFRGSSKQENLEKILMLLNETKEGTINVSKLEELILYTMEEDDLDLSVLYSFEKYIPGIRKKIDANIKGNMILSNICCQYLLSNETADEEFIKLSMKAIKNVLIDNEEQIDLLNKIKNLAIKRNLYDEIIKRIKTCGDQETIVYASLSYEPRLIQEIFESKINMYLYLTANTFTDEEQIELLKSRLLNMDNKEFINHINNKAEEVNQKIKKKIV